MFFKQFFLTYKEKILEKKMLSKILLPVSIPMKILLVLVNNFDEQGFMLLRDFKKYCTKDSQISHALTSLEEDRLITREKVGRQTKIIIMDKGRRYIDRYISTAIKYISDFFNFFKKENIPLIQQLNTDHPKSLDSKIIFTKNKSTIKSIKTQVYEFLNKNSYVLLSDLYNEFPDKNHKTLKEIYYKWEKEIIKECVDKNERD